MISLDELRGGELLVPSQNDLERKNVYFFHSRYKRHEVISIQPFEGNCFDSRYIESIVYLGFDGRRHYVYFSAKHPCVQIFAGELRKTKIISKPNILCESNI